MNFLILMSFLDFFYINEIAVLQLLRFEIYDFERDK